MARVELAGTVSQEQALERVKQALPGVGVKLAPRNAFVVQRSAWAGAAVRLRDNADGGTTAAVVGIIPNLALRLGTVALGMAFIVVSLLGNDNGVGRAWLGIVGAVLALIGVGLTFASNAGVARQVADALRRPDSGT